MSDKTLELTEAGAALLNQADVPQLAPLLTVLRGIAVCETQMQLQEFLTNRKLNDAAIDRFIKLGYLRRNGVVRPMAPKIDLDQATRWQEPAPDTPEAAVVATPVSASLWGDRTAPNRGPQILRNGYNGQTQAANSPESATADASETADEPDLAWPELKLGGDTVPENWTRGGIRGGSNDPRDTKRINKQQGAGAVNSLSQSPQVAVLAATEHWLQTLPMRVKVDALRAKYPRILNKIAATWRTPEEAIPFFNELLIDNRGGRQGFPFDVLVELTELNEIHEKFFPRKNTVWGHKGGF